MINRKRFNIRCTGGLVASDLILWREPVYKAGSAGKEREQIGERWVVAMVWWRRWDAASGEYVYHLLVMQSEGVHPIGKHINIYRRDRDFADRGVFRTPWKYPAKSESMRCRMGEMDDAET